MPRDLVVGNGTLLVNLDRHLNIRDLYYPHVGLYNHVGGHPSRIGVWVDGQFSWLDDTWAVEIGYRPGTLTTDACASNGRLGIALRFNDTVHPDLNVFLRRITVENLHAVEREIKVFLHHDFRVYETEIGDTVFYHPFTNSMIHFKRDCWILMSGRAQNEGIHEYTTGIKEFGGAEGTWRDAEDGILSGHPIDQGSVDSTISFRLRVPGDGRETLHCWIALGRSLEEVENLSKAASCVPMDAWFSESEGRWRSWIGKGVELAGEWRDAVGDLYERSLLTLQTQIDRSGGILAANDTDIMQTARAHYSYIWPRDGALVARALDLAGHPEPARRFFSFCAGILPPERPFFLQKYAPDGSLGATWHPWIADGGPEIPCQQDGTALVLWAVGEHCGQYRDKDFVCSIYEDLVGPAADHMVRTLDPKTRLPHPSYDLWEQRRGVHLFTCAALHGALTAAVKLARLVDPARIEWYGQARDDLKKATLSRFFDERLNRFVRSLSPPTAESEGLDPDPTIDAGMAGVFLFGMLPASDPRVVSTMEAIYDRLWVRTPVGGLARYEDDHYFQVTSDVRNVPGNPWFVSTLWMAEWYIAAAANPRDLEPAMELLQWAARNASEAGLLAEQVHPQTGGPLSVMPLTWSHAAFVSAVLGYQVKARELASHADRPRPA